MKTIRTYGLLAFLFFYLSSVTALAQSGSTTPALSNKNIPVGGYMLRQNQIMPTGYLSDSLAAHRGRLKRTDDLFTSWDSSRAITVISVADLPAIRASSKANLAIVRDAVRGGIFRFVSKSAASLTVDNGIVFETPNGYFTRVYSGPVDAHWFGAKGDNATNDRTALMNTIKSNRTIQFDGSTYKANDIITISGQHDFTIDFGDASVINGDTTKQSFYFVDCYNFSIKRGRRIGYQHANKLNGGGQQHVFHFNRCERFLLEGLSIVNSPEMGAALTNCVDATIRDMRVEHTMRDGFYMRYVANITYENCVVRYAKDDCYSAHDKDNNTPGRDSEKDFLLARGFKQTTNVKYINCRAEHGYQGFTSIGGSELLYRDCIVKRTVGAAFGVFHITNDIQETSRAHSIKLFNCQTDSTGIGDTFAGTYYPNFGKWTTGRAAYFFGNLNANYTILSEGNKRLSDIEMVNCTSTNAFANAFWTNGVDRFTMTRCKFWFSSAADGSTTGGIPVEFRTTTQLDTDNNEVYDNRPGNMTYGVQFDQVSGKSINWNITGYSINRFYFPNGPINDLDTRSTADILTGSVKCGLSATQTSSVTNAFSFPHGAPFTPTSGFAYAATIGADNSKISYLAFDPTSTTVFYNQNLTNGQPIAWYYCVYK